MTDFLQLFFSGMATGCIYALAALGFTLLWQASGTINFAQGEFVMLPAFVMVIMLHQGLPLTLAFLLSCGVAVLLLGWLLIFGRLKFVFIEKRYSNFVKKRIARFVEACSILR